MCTEKSCSLGRDSKELKDLLRVDDNKTELFSFLSHQVNLLRTEGKTVYATDGHDALCSMAQTYST